MSNEIDGAMSFCPCTTITVGYSKDMNSAAQTIVVITSKPSVFNSKVARMTITMDGADYPAVAHVGARDECVMFFQCRHPSGRVVSPTSRRHRAALAAAESVLCKSAA